MVELLLWMLAILLAILLGIWGLAIYWRQQIKDGLKNLGAELRQRGGQSRRLRSEGGGFAPSDPEPFGSLSDHLNQHLDAADELLHELLAEYGSIQIAATEMENGDLPILARLPRTAWVARARLNQLQKDFHLVEQEMADADEMMQKLNQQGWEVALLARQSMEVDQTALRVLVQLYAANLRDPDLENSIKEGKQWEETLERQVPVYFMTGDQKAVLAQADKPTIARVYKLGCEANSMAESLMEKARDWDARRADLEGALDNLSKSFREISQNISEAEAHQTRPLQWDESRAPLAEIRQKIENIGNINKVRSLAQLDSDLETTRQLLAELETLGDKAAARRERHTELLGLLDHPNVRQGGDWARGAQKLSGQVAGYDPANWPREHGAETLLQDLKKLVDYQQTLTGPNTGPVKESELNGMLEKARGLTGLHEDLRPRVEGIRARFDQIQENERTARDQLARLRALLNQATALAGANPVLEGGMSEFGQIRTQVEPLIAELEDPKKGSVEDKAVRVQGLTRKADQVGNKWLAVLENDLDEKYAILQKKVDALGEIAALDDAPVLEAKKLLVGYVPSADGRGKGEGGSGREGGLGGLGSKMRSLINKKEVDVIDGPGLAEAINIIRQINQDWQNCAAVLRSVEDLEGPVLEAADRLEEQRNSARQLMARAVELLPERRTWPPTNQNISGERGTLDSLERQLSGLCDTPIKAITLVAKLATLAQAYQTLAEKVRLQIKSAETDIGNIRALEQRLEESKRMWITVRDAHRDDTDVRSSVQLLIQDTDIGYEDVQVRYERGGLSYNHVLQNMRQLVQKLDGMVIPIGSGEVIDINGDVSADR